MFVQVIVVMVIMLKCSKLFDNVNIMINLNSLLLLV